MAPKKKGVAPDATGATAVVPVRAEAFMFHNDEEAHPAEGACIADSLVVLKIFPSKAKAIQALDATRSDWLTYPRSSLRDDQRNEKFLGIPGETWHIQIVARLGVGEFVSRF